MRPKLAFAMSPGKTVHVFDADLLTRLARTCDIVTTAPIEDFSLPAAQAALAQIDILVTGWGAPTISAAVIAAAPRLRLIAHSAGTVKNLVDQAVYDAGILVTHAAEANAIPVAEYTLAAILFANKSIFSFRDSTRAGSDPTLRSALFDTNIGNYRRTVGLVGASRVGRKVCHLLECFDIEVLLTDPFVRPDDPITRSAQLVDLDTLLARADTVSIHAPLLASTRGMIGARELGLMKQGATLINTARGAVIDEAALIAELETGRIHAILDVTSPEPAAPDSPLRRLPNVTLTPHIAGAIGTERLRLGLLVIEEIERFVAGQRLAFAIEPTLLEQIA